MTSPVLLMILDGFGLTNPGPGNAVTQAHTPNLDRLQETCPQAKLEASGQAVGLPQGQMGNSEVGHMNIGAGRILPKTSVKTGPSRSPGKKEGSSFNGPFI